MFVASMLFAMIPVALGQVPFHAWNDGDRVDRAWTLSAGGGEFGEVSLVLEVSSSDLEEFFMVGLIQVV